MKSCRHRGLAIPRILRASGLASLAAGIVLIPINIAWASSGQMVGFVPADAYGGMMTVLPMVNLALIAWAVVATLIAHSMFKKVHELEYEVDHLRQMARLTARERMVAPDKPIGQREHSGASAQAANDDDAWGEGHETPRGRHSAPKGTPSSFVMERIESLREGLLGVAPSTGEPEDTCGPTVGEGAPEDRPQTAAEADAAREVAPAADEAALSLASEELAGILGSALGARDGDSDGDASAPEADVEASEADETPAWLRADDPSISGMISQLEDEMGIAEGRRTKNDAARRAGAYDPPQAKADDEVRRLGRALTDDADRQAALDTLDEEPAEPAEPAEPSWYSARELEQIERRATESPFDPLEPQTADVHRREELDRGLRTGKIVPIEDVRAHLTGQLEPVTREAFEGEGDASPAPAEAERSESRLDAPSSDGAEDGGEDAFPTLSAASVVDEMIAELSHARQARKAN